MDPWCSHKSEYICVKCLKCGKCCECKGPPLPALIHRNSRSAYERDRALRVEDERVPTPRSE